jgi:hypothetical protein
MHVGRDILGDSHGLIEIAFFLIEVHGVEHDLERGFAGPRHQKRQLRRGPGFGLGLAGTLLQSVLLAGGLTSVGRDAKRLGLSLAKDMIEHGLTL